MKLINGIAFLMILFVVACNNAPDRPDPILDPATTPTTTTTTSSTIPPATTAGTNSNVPHYICPNNCAGGGGPAAGPCPVCGSTMTHNAAFHNQPAANTQTTPPPPGTNTPVPTTPPAGGEPAQNANGVWHYTCNNGCPGGAGSAIACATCGTTLVHNTLYHQ